MYLLLEKNGIISIVVHKDSTAADVLQSFIHALVMSKLAGEKRDVHMESELWIEKHYKIFISKVFCLLQTLHFLRDDNMEFHCITV